MKCFAARTIHLNTLLGPVKINMVFIEFASFCWNQERRGTILMWHFFFWRWIKISIYKRVRKDICQVRMFFYQHIINARSKKCIRKKKDGLNLVPSGASGWRDWRGQVVLSEGHSCHSGGAVIWAITGAVGKEFAILSGQTGMKSWLRSHVSEEVTCHLMGWRREKTGRERISEHSILDSPCSSLIIKTEIQSLLRNCVSEGDDKNGKD